MGTTLADNIRAKINQSKSNHGLAIIFGCLSVFAWTLIRFFNRGPNFDQVGQQVLAHQWLHGLHSGSVIGPTNYVLKMLLLYMPLDSVPLSAQLKLVLMTLLVNIATFVLLVYILRRLWLEFYPNLKGSFYLPLVYLSLISGSVYWISFSNSRNLEVASGVFLIYLYIRTQTRPSRLSYAGLIILGGLIFFADPLQIYMTMLPVILFVGIRWVLQRDQQQLVVLIRLIGCAVISILLARFLTKTVEVIWNVSFISTNRSVSFSLSSLKLTIEQMARLYAGGFEGGRIREALDLLIVAGGTVGAGYYAWRKPKARWLLSLGAIVWIVDLGVYIISGQAQQTDTNRYLIMTVPMFILALAVILYYLPSTKTRMSIVVFIVLFNSLTLAGGFAKAWDPHFSYNNHDRAVISYFKAHKYSYGYASIGTAVSSDYLSNWRVNLLPLGCDPDYTLKKTTLFFDKAGFEVAKGSSPESLVPIVLDGKDIQINSSVCGIGQIERQLGASQKTDHLNDGSTVLIYKAARLQNLRS